VCGAIRYQRDGRTAVSHFPRPDASLPVLLKGGGAKLVTWGRRQGEAGVLPQSGWARLDSVQSGKWTRYAPVPVRIEAEEFMDKDRFGIAHWYPLGGASFIQGLLARHGTELRVYIVTVNPPRTGYGRLHDRWPRIVTESEPPGRPRSAAVQVALF
jgi:hypothetical protein